MTSRATLVRIPLVPTLAHAIALALTLTLALTR